MANYLLRMMNRDLAKTKLRVLGTSALILMAVAAYVSVAAMIPTAENALEARVDSLALSHYMVHVDRANVTISDAVGQIEGVHSADYRLTVSSRVRYVSYGETKNVSAMLIGIDPTRIPDVNKLEIDRGSYFSENSSGEALIEAGFGDREGIEPGGTLSVLTGAGYSELGVVAQVSSAEFMLLPFNPQSILPLPGTLAVVYLPIDDLRTMLGFGYDEVNEILVLFDEDADAKATISSINEILAPGGIIFALERDQVYGYAIIREDLSSGEDFAGIIAFMVLFAAFFVLYSHFSRTVEEQKRQIGVLKALGYSRNSVLGSYVYMALVMGVIGSIVGLIAGYPLAMIFSNYYASAVIGASSAQLVFTVEMVLIAFSFGPATACLACGVAAWGTASMDPHDAMREMRSQRRARRRARRQARKAALPHVSFITLYTLRNMFRRKKRTVFTVVAVAFAIVIGGMAFPLMGSFNNSMKASIEDHEHWDLVAEYSYPLNGSEVEGISSASVSETVQIAKMTGVWLHGAETGTAVIISLEEGQSLHDFNLLKGVAASSPSEAMIGYSLSKNHHVEIGDLIGIEGPVGTIELHVTAILADLIGDLFVHTSVVETMAGEAAYSGFYAKCLPGEIDEASEDLLTHPLVANVVLKEDVQSGLLDLMQSYTSLLYAFSMVGVGIATVTIANMVFMGILERYKEYGQLRAIGYSKRSTSKSIMTEVAVIVVLGGAVSLPLLYVLLESFVESFKAFWPVYETMIMTEDMIGYAVAIALTLGFGALSAIPAIRYLNKMDLARVVSGSRFG